MQDVQKEVEISVEREKFISLLLKIRISDGVDAGVSDEELHDIDQNLGQKRSVRPGRKPGSRNVKTIDRERLNTKTDAHFDRVCEELGISKEEFGELRRKEVQKLSEPEQPGKPGRKKRCQVHKNCTERTVEKNDRRANLL